MYLNVQMFNCIYTKSFLLYAETKNKLEKKLQQVLYVKLQLL